MYIKSAQQNRYYMSAAHVSINLNRIVPMVIEYGENKKIRFSLNYFLNNQELIKILEEKTGKKVE